MHGLERGTPTSYLPATPATPAPAPSPVIHLVGMDVFTARAAAVDRPRTSLNLYILDVAFVCFEERTYDGFLVAFLYHVVVVHDGRLSSAFEYFGGVFPDKRGIPYLSHTLP